MGLLKEKPESYGYELLAYMEANYFQYFVRFTKGSFYYNLQQLEEKSLLERINVSSEVIEKEKNRYVITEKGEQEFDRLFLKYGHKNDVITFSFYTPMLFAEEITSENMIDLLEVQIEQTKEKIRLIEDSLKNPGNLRKPFIQMMENSKRHHQVNLQWFQEQLSEYQ
ncbi:hypothetical protein RV04_GL001114 [Enterococcus hermanniensis]|uniref:Transcription regulator PadR N-terminal domain-containing protein n=1 Tax=Enterococcus hermanniensis TaxID=249189 RepID=A0A1L8TQU9_9ENTE|nr:hypothetical protein RV04_GL001114 [Enterococcus hermanniensis]